MKDRAVKIKLKKQTLSAWAGILLANGTIELTKYNRMLSKINQIKA